MLGGFLIWFAWIEAEPVGTWLIDVVTDLPDALREHLLDSAIYMRPVTMGLLLLLVLRFWPRGLIPEESGADSR